MKRRKPMNEDEPKSLPRPTKAQNIFAVTLTAAFIAFAVIGGWYLRTHSGGRGAGGPMTATSAGSASTELTSRTVNGVKFDFKGKLQIPQSEIQIEARDAQGNLVDVGTPKLTLVMNMPGMVMRDEAQVTGSGGRYKARVKHDMAGEWAAELSFSGPGGGGQTTFKVNVKG